MEKPCLPKDVLFFQFNFDNLANFLDYLENRYKETSFNQSELKARLENFEQLFDNMKNRIPDFKALTTEIDKKFQAVNEKFDKFEGFFEKINQVEKNISKLNDFELKSKEKLDKINLMQDDLALLYKASEDSNKKIEKLQYQFMQLDSDFTNKVAEIETGINKLNLKTDKIPGIVKDILDIKEAMGRKFTKVKQTNVKTGGKIVEIESSIKTMFSWFGTLNTGNNSKIEESNRTSAQESQLELQKKLDEAFEEIGSFKERTVKEIEDLKQLLINIKKNDSDDKIKMSKEEKTQLIANVSQMSLTLKELQNNEKFFISAISGKVGREELEKNQKSLFSEIEKTNNKVSKYSKDILSINNKLEEQAAEVKKEDNIVTMMGGVEEIKRVMIETIRDNEQIAILKGKQTDLEGEISRLNEMTAELSKVLKEELSNPQLIDNKDLVNRISAVESNERYFKSMIDEIKGEDFVTTEQQSSKTGINFRSSAQRKNSMVKDFVLDLNVSVAQLNDRLDRVNSRFDSLNKEILEKVRKDLLLESNKILDDFRLDLKFSISKIEEQMREKVDKFNMEEFTRKFEKRILLEINSKIDRVDMKKNNSLINKKIEGLENKISKTLVDTLIDLQMEEAPLLVKKSQTGSDKCASCNQSIPLNFMNHVHCITEMNSNNPTSTKGNTKSMKTQTQPVDKPDLKNANSSGIFSNLPEINHFDQKSEDELELTQDESGPNKIKANYTNSFKQFDERAERQLTGLIKEELTKSVVNPENLIKASKKVYDNLVEKRIK